MNLQDLKVDHDYYCSDSNYYSNDAGTTYDNVTDFLEDFSEADIDMNLVFRWDVKPKGDVDDWSEGYYPPGESDTYAEIFMMLQTKGLFRPIQINNVFEKDVELLVEYLQKHKEKLDSIWKPL